MTDVKVNLTRTPALPVRILRRMGVDRAIGYSVISRAWGSISTPLTMYLIVRFFSPAQQGLYYNFNAALGITVIFELGLVYVISQFASHEMAKLRFGDRGILEGDARAKGRLASLLKKAMFWYMVVGLLILVGLIPAGLLFFDSAADAGFMWRAAWIAVVCTTAASCAVSPIYAVLGGCGLVAEITRQRLAQEMIGEVALWLAIALGFGLLATPVQTAFMVVIEIGWLALTRRDFFVDMLATARDTEHQLSWRKEIWPLQWRVALTWIAGYLMAQTFTPILTETQGDRGLAIAGQWGMSWVLAYGFAPAASAWINTKGPRFGMLVADRKFDELNKLFFKAAIQSFFLMLCYALCAMGAIFFLNYINHPYAKRILDPLPFGILVASALINHFVFAEAVYLRAHKEEPFLVPSLINAACVLVSNITLGKYFGALGMAAGYCGVTLVVGLGLGTLVFQYKRRQWRNNLPLEAAAAETGRFPV